MKQPAGSRPPSKPRTAPAFGLPVRGRRLPIVSQAPWRDRMKRFRSAAGLALASSAGPGRVGRMDRTLRRLPHRRGNFRQGHRTARSAGPLPCWRYDVSRRDERRAAWPRSGSGIPPSRPPLSRPSTRSSGRGARTSSSPRSGRSRTHTALPGSFPLVVYDHGGPPAGTDPRSIANLPLHETMASHGFVVAGCFIGERGRASPRPAPGRRHPARPQCHRRRSAGRQHRSLQDRHLRPFHGREARP